MRASELISDLVIWNRTPERYEWWSKLHSRLNYRIADSRTKGGLIQITYTLQKQAIEDGDIKLAYAMLRARRAARRGSSTKSGHWLTRWGKVYLHILMKRT